MGCGFGAQLPSVLTVRFPSAFCNAIHKATSCPAPCQSCVRSRSAVGSGRCMLVGCPLDLLFAQARAAAADLSSLVPVNTPECNQLNLPIKCSAGHASHAQPWHTLARSPGTHTGTHTGTNRMWCQNLISSVYMKIY